MKRILLSTLTLSLAAAFANAADKPAAAAVAVAAHDISVNHYNELDDLPPHTLREMQRFFEDYKALEHKSVTVQRFLPREEAYRIIEESIRLYNETFPNGNDHDTVMAKEELNG